MDDWKNYNYELVLREGVSDKINSTRDYAVSINEKLLQFSNDSAFVEIEVSEQQFEKIEIDFPPEFLEIKILLEEIYNKKVSELREIVKAAPYAKATAALPHLNLSRIATLSTFPTAVRGIVST